MKFCLSRLLAMAVVILGVNLSPANAQTTSSPVLVYKMEFGKAEDSINFRSYQSGYLVVDAGATGTNTASVILTQVVGGVRNFYYLADYAQMFYAKSSGSVKAVVTGTKTTKPGTTTTGGTTTTTTATTSQFIYATGDAGEEKTIELVNGEANVSIAALLEGYGIFCDSQEDLPFATAAGENVGTAGMVTLKLRYDEGQSEAAQKQNQDRVATITAIAKDLANDGYVGGDTASTALTKTQATPNP